MSFEELSKKLRLVRSQMPRVSAKEAYAQMDRLLAAQKRQSHQSSRRERRN